jgi:Flp pilus assembly protein TadD
MKNSPELRKAQKQEQEDNQRQRNMVDDIERQILSAPAGSKNLEFRPEDVSPAIAQVRDEAKRAKSPREVRVCRRAVNELLVAAYENGEGRLRNGDAHAAEVYFQVAALVAPDSAGPHFELAKIYVKLGDKKKAIRELETAVNKGLKRVSLLKDSPEFAPLRDEPRFQELVSQLEGKQ